LDLDDGSEFAWAQRGFCDEIERQYNNGDPVRILVLKARQLGISTAAEGVLFHWSFLHGGTNGLVVGREADATEDLFLKTKMYWETWPFRGLYSLKYQTRRQLHWIETRSNLRVATAKNIGTGRGSTLHAVHLTECAFYDDPETLMTGLNQAVPQEHGTIVILESTANGTGNWWHDTWRAAEEGDSDYIPLFFPWYKHYEYQRPTTLSTLIELTPDERQIMQLGASFENIEWYRWALYNKVTPGDEQALHQEYPSTPEDAFISTGQRIFPHDKLTLSFKEERGHRGYLNQNEHGKVEFVHDSSGNVTIFRAPRRGDTRSDRYFIAGDPSMTIEGDPACMQVINRQTYEQVAVWHGRIDPVTFGSEMILLGRFYNDCMLCPEVEGGGQSTVAVLLTKGYPSIWQHRWADKSPGKVAVSYGWSTNFNRKSWAIGVLKRRIIDQSITIHDRKTYNQLDDYVVRNDGTWGNSGTNGHDDAVMALAIGITASETEGPFVPDRVSDNIIVDLFNQELDAGAYEGMLA
jgi:hypothetical protein